MRDTTLDRILPTVEKPVRYIGNEWNSVHKNRDEIAVRFAFCFPDLYEIGMSHLGMKILYHLMNDRADIWCERVFAPWIDMEEKMREAGIPLFGLESGDPLCDFDFIGFTLQYEMSYTNILNMLDLAAIPVMAAERDETHPFICAGGPCACNPEPLADFIDFFMLGDGEEVIIKVIEAYKEWKSDFQSENATENVEKNIMKKTNHVNRADIENPRNSDKSKIEIPERKSFLRKIAMIEGVYVPSLYRVDYHEDGTIKAFYPQNYSADPEYISHVPSKIKKSIVKDLDKAYFPEKIIVPYTGIVHDRITLELFRGCKNGCRFCQAGYTYRPVRERSISRLSYLADKLVESTGYEEISLSSLSTSDYPQLSELTRNLADKMQGKKVSLSLPSLRIDSLTLDLMDKVSKVRKSGITLAPEAGTQRLRDVINKGVTEEDLMRSASVVFEAGYGSIKLYFMLGLPTETLEDIDAIAILGNKVASSFFKAPVDKRAKGVNINISTSFFVPKPFTPFQWEPQIIMHEMRERAARLKNTIRGRNISYNWHEPRTSLLEAVFSRGDRRTGVVLKKAWESGCKFDSWGEQFRFDLWMKAFEGCGLDAAFYANRRRNIDEILPWDHIDMGISKAFLIKEAERAANAKTTPDCETACSGCGLLGEGAGLCVRAGGGGV